MQPSRHSVGIHIHSARQALDVVDKRPKPVNERVLRSVDLPGRGRREVLLVVAQVRERHFRVIAAVVEVDPRCGQPRANVIRYRKFVAHPSRRPPVGNEKKLASLAAAWVVLVGVLFYAGFNADDPGLPLLLF